MNKIAKELTAIAKELIAVRSDFTIIKTLQLKKDGATRDGLENARRIKGAGYDLLNGTFEFSRSNAEWTTTAFFRRAYDGDKVKHVFKSFSFGYGGEGPRGMEEFLEIFGWGPDPKKILNPAFMADQDSGKIRLKDLT